MADYYVDFSSGTNGDGSAGSPWNVFTGTQNAGVTGGDSVWFRRYVMAVDTKFITWKAGTSNSSRINYIGWPKSGDAYYSARVESLKATWDYDGADYAYQRKSAWGTGAAAVPLPSFVNVYRFYMWDDYTATTNCRRACEILNVAGITLENCYMWTTYNPITTAGATWYGGSLYIENANTIVINNSTIDGAGTTTAATSASTFKIKNTQSTTFSGCNFKWGIASSAAATTVATIDDTASSYVESSNLSFTACNFYFSQCYSVVASYAAANQYGVSQFKNSTVTMSGCNIYNDNINSVVTVGHLLPASYPYPCIRVRGTTSLSMYNTTASCTINKAGLISLSDTSSLIIDTLSWSVNSTNASKSVVFLELISYSSVSLSNITGSVQTGTGEYGGENYFIAFVGWNNITSSTLSMTNVAGGLGKLLDASRTSNTVASVSLNNVTNPALGYDTIYMSSVGSIDANTTSIGGFKFFSLTYVSTAYISGFGTSSGVPFSRIRIRNSNISKTPIQLQPTNATYLDCAIYNCVGNGTDVFNGNSNIVYFMYLLAIRNRGFTGVGTLADLPWIEACAVLNDFNNGTSQYTSNLLTYETATVSRIGGAGYTVKVIKKIDDTVPVIYPNIGEDSTWVYIPAAGNYSIVAYAIYTCSSGTLGSSDIMTGVDIMGSYSTEDKVSTVSVDTGSTWEGAVGGNAIKITNTVTITREQYCPVKLYINKKLPNLITYFDPKLDVTAL